MDEEEKEVDMICIVGKRICPTLQFTQPHIIDDPNYPPPKKT
jgi:hypothetical protein